LRVEPGADPTLAKLAIDLLDRCSVLAVVTEEYVVLSDLFLSLIKSSLPDCRALGA
jgi:hypothetical protein